MYYIIMKVSIMKYEYVKVNNQGNFIDDFVSNHIKITLSNGNIIRVFDDNTGIMNVVELYNENDEIISGLTESELSQFNSFKEFIV
jgi:hypothetical protein